MNTLDNSFSLQVSDKTNEKESSIQLSGTSAVLGIALIAFGIGYAFASTTKKAL